MTNSVGTVTYAWKNIGNTTVGTTATVTGLPAGAYTLTVTDGCRSVTCSQTILQPSGALAIGTCTHTNVTCGGASTGSVTAGTVTNSFGTVSYAWKNSGNTTVGTTSVVTGLPADTYTLTVTDGCGSTTCSQTITAGATLSMGACSHTNVTCGGGNTGSVSAGTLSNSSGQVTYLWKNSGNTTVGTTSTVTGLPADTYTLTVTDACGSVTCFQTIMQPTSGSLTMDACTHTDVTCFGANTGSVTAGFVSGASGSVAYTWRNSSNGIVGTTANVTNLGAGTYSLVVTDACGSTSCTQTVNQPAAALSMTACSHVDATCGGAGSVTAGTISNSVGNVSYSWKNSSNNVVGTTASVTGLSPGTYTLTVTDNCGSITCFQVIGSPSTVTGTTSSTSSGCSQSTGTASVVPSGGTVPYSYLWSPGGQTTQTATNLAGGTYIVTITDDNGCSGTASAVVQSSGGNPSLPGPISGPAGACKGQCGVVYSIDPVQGATSYVWTLPAGATGTSTGTSITLCFTTSYRGGFICVRAVSTCGQSSNVCLNIPRINSMPSTPGNISGPVSLCPGQTATYSINPVSGATAYQWTGTGGLIINSGNGTTSISVTAPPGFVSGSIKVNAKNCKGTSGTKTLNVIGIPSTPIWKYNPPIFVCSGQCYVFNIDNVQDANTWTFTGPPNSTISSPGTPGSGNPLTTVKSVATICFPLGFVSGTVTIVSTNSCGNSQALVYNVSSMPPAPAFISGQENGVCNSNNNSYSVPAVPGATSYTWTVPAGAQIQQNNGNSIKVGYLSNFVTGNICVSVNTSCGTSQQTCLAVNAAPEPPSIIDGPSSVCKSETNVKYSNPGSYGATNFVWTVSGGATIANGQGSRIVKIDFPGSTSNTIVLSVRATNSCGTSTVTSLTINVNPNCRVSGTQSDLIGIENISAFPNPASDKATVTFNSEINAKYSLKVIDLLGNVLITEELSAVEGYNSKEIDLKNISKGIYIVNIQSEGINSRSLRLVVE